jgi:hypothetical protein
VIDNSWLGSYGYVLRTEVHGSLGCVRTDKRYRDLALVSSAEGRNL